MMTNHIDSPHALIFGAGKIGRGFIAHLLHQSKYIISFVDNQEKVVVLLKQNKEYPVVIMGAPEKNIRIPVHDAWLLNEKNAISNAIVETDVIFTAVGGQNLELLGSVMAQGIKERFQKGIKISLNIIICENYHQPARLLRESIVSNLDSQYHNLFQEYIGIAETQVQRSVIEPTPEMIRENPLSLSAQDWWEMPVDADALKPPIPVITGFKLIKNFKNSLQRKLYTYNATNAVICYLGYLKGYTYLADASDDREIISILERTWKESNPAIVQILGYTSDDQKIYAESALKKYQKREIVDPIERNARDPIRKLGRFDRLIGPACLALDCGIQPVAYAYVIAAAFHYDHPDDPKALELQSIIRNEGLSAAIERICALQPEHTLHKLILARYRDFKNVKNTHNLPLL